MKKLSLILPLLLFAFLPSQNAQAHGSHSHNNYKKSNHYYGQSYSKHKKYYGQKYYKKQHYKESNFRKGYKHGYYGHKVKIKGKSNAYYAGYKAGRNNLKHGHHNSYRKNNYKYENSLERALIRFFRKL